MISRRVLQHAGTELNKLRATRSGSLIGAGALALALGACSAGDEADGMPTYGNVPSFGSGNGTATNGSTSNGSNTSTQSNSNGSSSNGSNNNGSQSNPPTQQNGSQNNGSQPSGSQTGSAQEGNPNGAPISNGNTNGTASNGAMAPGAGGASNGAMAPGAGGASNGGNPMPPNNGNETPPPANNGNQNPPPPAAPDITCPAGAIFCSGFEGTGLPAGATFEPSYLAATALGSEVELDSTVVHSGKQSLKMPVGHNYYRMLTVETPASYWVRVYTRSNVGFGAQGSTHASLYMGSTLAPGEYNGDKAVELAEQFTQIQLNKNDDRFGTTGHNPGPGSAGTTLPSDTWVCLETQFDGASGDVHVYVEGKEIINAAGWQPPTAYKTFRFGYLRFDSPARDVWMDDVIVAPNRVGCP